MSRRTAVFVSAILVLLPMSTITTRAAAAVPIIVSPAAGSRTASVSTQISLLGASANGVTSIRVVGSRSGLHRGRLEAYSASAGKSFIPTEPFDPGEEVTVAVGRPVVGAASGTYHFVVGERLPIPNPTNGPTVHLGSSAIQHFASAPSLDPPAVDVLLNHSAATGDYLLSPKGSVGEPGPMILNGAGQLVWFDPLGPSNVEAFDLNEQRLGNKPVLTWWQGRIVDGHGVGVDEIVNSSYQTVATLTGGNGFAPDLHEFQLEPDGLALVTSYQALRWNTSPAGGIADGSAWDGIVQEIDVRTGLVVYEWHSLDHVAVQNSEAPAPQSPGSAFDYFHVNSIQLLEGGTLLISARNTSAAYEISPSQGGEVLWTLGGKASTFAMGPGATFYFQHDVRELNPTTITIFDDEAGPSVKSSESRAIVLHLDPSTKQADLAKAYLPPEPRLGVALGNLQTLSSGNVVVSWGTTPYFSEYSAAGTLLFDASLPHGDDTYRVYQDSWQATPTTYPSLAVASAANTNLRLSMSWNGATAVASWRVESGATPDDLRNVTTVKRSGFETTVTVARAAFVRVEALAADGSPLGSSSVEPTTATTG